nr:MAG TPA: hypothetical protein [Caudoviricetes sp.]
MTIYLIPSIRLIGIYHSQHLVTMVECLKYLQDLCKY